MKKLLSLFVFLAVFLSAPLALKAQDTSGMTGQVTDATGAAVPGATVTLTNHATGLHFTAKTDASGTYRFNNIPPAPGYEAVFSAAGFSPYDIKGISLLVSQTRTQNAKLSAGANVEVQVTASNSEVTIDTTDATIGNTFDPKMLNDLPVYNRSDPTALFTLQPGVTDTGSVTGARTDQNDITLDGMDVNDFATGGAVQSNSGISEGFSTGSIVGHAPIDSVEEFSATVGGYQAQNGPGSGGQFQLVTKSGTNSFHGNINEYHRDPSLLANQWFSNDSTPQVPRQHLIQNQFGGNIGGPIIHNKLFFFFDYNNSRIIKQDLQQITVPLPSLRAGILSYKKADGTIGTLTPTQVAQLDPAGIGEDANLLNAVNARFPAPNNSATGDGLNSGGYDFNAPANDFLVNYVGRIDYNITSTQKIFGRFTIARENGVQTPNAAPEDTTITNPFIDRTYAFVVGHTWTIGNNKSNQFYIGETVENFAFPSLLDPTGANDFVFADGTGSALISNLYNQPDTQSRRIPMEELRDDFTWAKGKHTFQFGGYLENIRAHNRVVGDFNSVQVGLGGHTLNLCGPATTSTPDPCGTNATTGAPNPSLRPSDIGSGTNVTLPYDQAFAYLLGRVGEVSADFNYNAQGQALPQLTGDQRVYQNWQTQLYFADSWKILPSLTITYGLNYQLFSVPYETRGLESTETMSYQDYISARIAQSAAGISGPNAVPILSYVLGGKANDGPPLYKPQHKLFAPRFAFAWNPDFDKKTVFNGSAALVYDRTIIMAIQSEQDADSYLFQQTLPIDEGIPNDPYDSIATDPRLGTNLSLGFTPQAPATPTPPYAPFTGAYCTAVGLPSPCGLQLGSAFNYTIDPNLKTPYSIIINGGMQHSFPGDFVMKLNYAGRFGRRLLGQPDANQILDFPDSASGQYLSQAFANLTLAARAGTTPAAQPWFEDVVTPGIGAANGFPNNTQFLAAALNGLAYNGDFGDFVQAISSITPANVGSAAQFSENTFMTNLGFSSYNALLASLQKNLSHGLQFDINYTFAHSIDNVSFFANSAGDTGIGGVGLICDVIRPRECRANSDYDVTNYVTGDATYQLPFGKGRAFVSNIPFWLNEVIGGWDVSAIVDWHSGQAWGTDSDAFDASYSNDAPGILVGQKGYTRTHVTKNPFGQSGVNNFSVAGGNINFPAQLVASQYTGPVGFQVGSRNSLRGPNFFNADMGLAKTFPIYSDRVNLKFRADAFNVFNHPSFGLPQDNVFNGFDQQDITSSTFGQISYTQPGAGNNNGGARILQVSLRLEF